MESLRKYQHSRIITERGSLANQDIIRDGVIYRVRNGFLNDSEDEYGNNLPAVEALDGSHIEHWKDGVLHCNDSPAITDKERKEEEWYRNGKKLPAGGK